jgi:hypothetical protein
MHENSSAFDLAAASPLFAANRTAFIILVAFLQGGNDRLSAEKPVPRSVPAIAKKSDSCGNNESTSCLNPSDRTAGFPWAK